MSRELDTLDALVAELLSYVQSDDLKLDYQTFDPTQGLADLVELVQYELPDKRIIEVELRLSPGIHVFADQRLFLRAIENLLRNAVRYADGKVLLELMKEEDQIRVAVHDDGPGIPKALRDKVMLPFYRLGKRIAVERWGASVLAWRLFTASLNGTAGRSSLIHPPWVVRALSLCGQGPSSSLGSSFATFLYASPIVRPDGRWYR